VAEKLEKSFSQLAKSLSKRDRAYHIKKLMKENNAK